MYLSPLCPQLQTHFKDRSEVCANIVDFQLYPEQGGYILKLSLWPLAPRGQVGDTVTECVDHRLDTTQCLSPLTFALHPNMCTLTPGLPTPFAFLQQLASFSGLWHRLTLQHLMNYCIQTPPPTPVLWPGRPFNSKAKEKGKRIKEGEGRKGWRKAISSFSILFQATGTVCAFCTCLLPCGVS